MREIKFRAWYRYARRMRVVDVMLLTTRPTITVKLAGESPIQYFGVDENVDLMQFINRLDKNGKEIYEGDLVYDNWVNPEYSRFEVYWNDDKWDLRDAQGKRYWETYGGPIYWDHMEVIGNIYENPSTKRDE